MKEKRKQNFKKNKIFHIYNIKKKEKLLKEITSMKRINCDIFEAKEKGLPIVFSATADLNVGGLAREVFKRDKNLSEGMATMILHSEDGEEVGAVLEAISGKSRYFILLTKETRYDETSYEIMEQCFNNLFSVLSERGIEEVAIPKIGSRGDHLYWDEVKDILDDIFKNTNITLNLTGKDRR